MTGNLHHRNTGRRCEVLRSTVVTHEKLGALDHRRHFPQRGLAGVDHRPAAQGLGKIPAGFGICFVAGDQNTRPVLLTQPSGKLEEIIYRPGASRMAGADAEHRLCGWKLLLANEPLEVFRQALGNRH